MNLPVSITSSDDRVTVSLIGAPEVTATSSTREEAMEQLRNVVDKKIDEGEIAALDFPAGAVTDFIGIFRDDPTIDEICEEAYRERDRELSD